ncbi:MAG: hypothetical protein NTW97_04530 [Candidatus Krumholzibacteria bacterium]|nr:hypothetical protein [Candidatus Krumholzibacteria bacterium]
MGIFATFGIGIIFAFILMVIIGGFLMWVAAKIARVEKSSFARAMAAAVAASFIEIFVAFLFNLIPVFGNLFGFILGLVIAILVIKGVFRTSFGKALLVWIFNLAAAFVALALAAMIMASSFLLSRGI